MKQEWGKGGETGIEGAQGESRRRGTQNKAMHMHETHYTGTGTGTRESWKTGGQSGGGGVEERRRSQSHPICSV
jgi:hypothetical protein